MGKTMITFGDSDSKIEKQKLHKYKNPIFKKRWILIINLVAFILVRKIIDTLLVTWMMIIKLNYYA